MGLYYSGSTGGFYNDMYCARSTIPIDAVRITESKWQELMEAQAQSGTTGKVIQSDAQGRPIIVDAEPPPASRWITKWLFNLRYTLQERVAIYTSTDPIVITIRNDYLIAPDPMNMDDPMTIQFLDYFVAVGIITSERKAEILA
jgi:hypothetical protein